MRKTKFIKEPRVIRKTLKMVIECMVAQKSHSFFLNSIRRQLINEKKVSGKQLEIIRLRYCNLQQRKSKEKVAPSKQMIMEIKPRVILRKRQKSPFFVAPPGFRPLGHPSN